MSSVPAARITGLYRYPVKGLTPEPLQSAPLRVGETLPADRRYALENGPSGFDPAAPVWRPKTAYLMLMRNERLAGFKTRFDDATNILTIPWGALADLTYAPAGVTQRDWYTAGTATWAYLNGLIFALVVRYWTRTPRPPSQPARDYADATPAA